MTKEVPLTQIEDLQKENKFLLEQQKTLQNMCNKIGSETAGWKHRCLRAEEENIRLKQELNYERTKNK